MPDLTLATSDSRTISKKNLLRILPFVLLDPIKGLRKAKRYLTKDSPVRLDAWFGPFSPCSITLTPVDFEGKIERRYSLMLEGSAVDIGRFAALLWSLAGPHYPASLNSGLDQTVSEILRQLPPEPKLAKSSGDTDETMT